MAKTPKYDEERAAQALAMVASGEKTQRQIADALGIGLSTLSRYVTHARAGKMEVGVDLPTRRTSLGSTSKAKAQEPADTASLARVLRDRASGLREEAARAEALLAEADRLDQAASVLIGEEG